MTNKEEKTLILVNLGGPRSSSEIEIFLRDLFSDPFVFDLPLPEFLRIRLARFIAKKRAPKVKKTYESMGFGGGSPLVTETEKQAKVLEGILTKCSGTPWKVKVAMACGFPNIRDSEFTKPNPNTLYLPLYPQFSRSTVLSALAILEEKFGECPVGSGGYVPHFGLTSKFHELTAQFIYEFFTDQLKKFQFLHYPEDKPNCDWKELDIVFSAHGVPMRLIQKGDRYMDEVEVSVNGIVAELRKYGFNGSVHISYQSKVGPAKWTEPSTIQKISELASNGKHIAVYPISFVSDHLETLEEIGEQFKELTLEKGGKSFVRIPALGVYEPFLQFLAEQTLAADNSLQHCICKERGGESLRHCRFKN
ncbi:ferrochelatase [Leptospira yanagawae serovar Saopaulo str. Sao Paulo = ATCC 700523]|uniref:Ferrochelatase n=1 Tax=Leptospira yanagawae serovar Saopaulo str. Sao Paulo = ATCC 700523 TaxID=1249483 RepID=A0A5E8HAN4_9LEPT|nr:ferrochelatase [Leptospira yanagawae]EOQ88531.1 ferrochelatase [Leptospira yanagawae serovar Saopaulo str. Sao Paulo = ATCC 700523]